MKLCEDARAAIEGASALVVCTPWPEYRQFPAQTLRSAMATPVVIDAGGFLSSSLGEDPGIVYVRVGSAAPAGARRDRSGGSSVSLPLQGRTALITGGTPGVGARDLEPLRRGGH